MFGLCPKKKLSSAEIHSALLKKATKYGIDKESLTTSMGGMDTDHTNLYLMVREEEANRRTTRAFWLSVIAIVISIIALFKS